MARIALLVCTAAVLFSSVGIVCAQAPQGDEEDSLLLKEPETPAEMFDAVSLMMRLGRPNLARRYLEQLVAANPTPQQLLEIRDQHGPAIFVRLARTTALRPESVTLLERVNEAFRQQGADPARLDALIADLKQDAQRREVALLALRAGGPAVVPRMLQHLGNSAKAADHDLLLYTLTRLGRDVVPPLLAAVNSPNENLRTVAIEALGWLAEREHAPYLWHAAYAPNQPAGVQAAARQALSRIMKSAERDAGDETSYGITRDMQRVALEHFRGDAEWERDPDTGKVMLWSWSAEQNTVAVTPVSPKTASLHVGTRMVKHALEISAGNEELQALFLAFALAYERHQVGSESPLPTGPGTAHQLALNAGREIVGRALRIALDNANSDAARGLLQVLGSIGTRHQLYSKNSDTSPMISALNYPDSWVQFAAADVVMQLDPEEPFRGARRVVQILTRALNDDAVRRALVVDASTSRGAGFAGLVGQLGYDPITAPTGRDGFEIAAERMDVEVIFLEVNTLRWPLSQTVATLRADARTASIPIVIYGSDEHRAAVQRLVDAYPLTTFVMRTATSDYLGQQLQPFFERIEAATPSAEQRDQMRTRAVAWLARIADGRRENVFDIAPAEQALRGVIDDPNTAVNALVALGAIPTGSVQQAFHDLIVNANQSREIRGTAALQLAFHIQRFGLMLDDAAVSALKAVQAQSADPELSGALAAVIGSLKPNAAQVQSRLESYELPEAPVGP